MSGSGHKDPQRNLSALLTWLEDARLDARRQREKAGMLRDSLRLARAKRVRLQQSSTVAVRVARPHTPGGEETGQAPALVAFAASAGGIMPLIESIAGFPGDLRAAVLIALHTTSESALPTLLQARCRLPVKFAQHGDLIRSGIVYVAPAEFHLIVNSNRTLALADKSDLRFAPSADWLFDCVAATYGNCAIAVVLSGYHDDGARGIVRISQAGGFTIVQDPVTCAAPGMPNASIRTGLARLVLPPDLIGKAVIDRLITLDFEQIEREFDNPFSATA